MGGGGGGGGGFGEDTAHWFLAGLRFSERLLANITSGGGTFSARYGPLIGLSCLSESNNQNVGGEALFLVDCPLERVFVSKKRCFL